MKIGVRHGHIRQGGDTAAEGIVNEIDVNEEYYQYVMSGLKSLGHEVFDCSPSNGCSLGQSLAHGINVAKENECEYFISCHSNATDDHLGRGCMVLYSSSSSKGKTLAENISKEISSLGFKNNGAVVSERSLYEINHGNSDGLTTVIIEPFFVDNQSDVDIWNKVGAKKLGEAIVKGITGSVPSTGSTPTVASNGRSSKSESIELESTDYEIVEGSQVKKDALFGRRIRVMVFDADGQGLEISQLRVVISATKSMANEPNQSIVKIYNLNTETENYIMNNAIFVTVEAGYEGANFGEIFRGDIIQAIRYKEDATTFVLELVALDCDKSINFNFVNFSLTKGLTARQQVDALKGAVAKNPINLGSISSSLDTSNRLTRGKCFFGKQSDYMAQIAKSNDAKCYYENGEVNIIKLDELPEGEILELNPQSGLVGFPEQTDFGIKVKSLINPQIKINTLFHIDNSYIRAKRISVSSNNTIPKAGDSSNSISASGVREKIIAEAKKICDDPNVRYSQPLRGQTVNGLTYWDCSSFVKHCYEAAGLSIVDITYPQYFAVEAEGKFVSDEEAQPGDIVFYGEGNNCSHVGIYAGGGYSYEAHGSNRAADDQVSYGKIGTWKSHKIGVPKCLLNSSVTPSVAYVKNGGSR